MVRCFQLPYTPPRREPDRTWARGWLRGIGGRMDEGRRVGMGPSLAGCGLQACMLRWGQRLFSRGKLNRLDYLDLAYLVLSEHHRIASCVRGEDTRRSRVGCCTGISAAGKDEAMGGGGWEIEGVW